MVGTMKSFVIQSRSGVDQFNDFDLAERHAKLNASASIYLRGQVSEIREGQLFLRACESDPFRRFS
jgi:hypothetical protein